MGARAEALAKRFEEANGAVIAEVEGCSDTHWRATTKAEGWSVAATAHHIGGGHEPIAGIVQAIATGQPLPGLTWEMINQGNAEHAKQFANCAKPEALELLRKSGAAAAGIVRGLSDEQLDRTATIELMGGASVSAQQFVEMVLLGHPQEHLESIRAAN